MLKYHLPIALSLCIILAACRDSAHVAPPATTASPVNTPTLVTRTPTSIAATATTASTPASTPILAQVKSVISNDNANKLTILAQWTAVDVNDVVWSPNSSQFAASFQETVDVFSIGLFHIIGPQEPQVITHELAFGLAFSPDGTRLAFSSYPFMYGVELWDAMTGKMIRRSSDKHECSGGDNILFESDGYTILTAYSIAERGDQPGRSIITLWDSITGECQGSFAEIDGWPIVLKASPDGQLLAASYLAGSFKQTTAGRERQVTLWSLEQQQELCQLKGYVTAFSADSKLLAIPDLDQDATLNLWHAETCRLARRLTGIPYPYGSSALAFSPNGQLIATGTKTIQIWDASSGKLLHKASALPNTSIDRVVFSPDGRFLLSVGKRLDLEGHATIILWGVSP